MRICRYMDRVQDQRVSDLMVVEKAATGED